MDINTYHYDGYLLWTALHRAARLNQLEEARNLLEQGADPNLRVRVMEDPIIDNKTCLELARNIFGRDCDRTPMRELLVSYGGVSGRML